MQFRTRSLFVAVTLACIACAILAIAVRSPPETNRPIFTIQNYGEHSLTDISLRIKSTADGQLQVLRIRRIPPYGGTARPILVSGDISFALEYVLNGERQKLENQDVRLWPEAQFVVTIFNEEGRTDEGYW